MQQGTRELKSPSERSCPTSSNRSGESSFAASIHMRARVYQWRYRGRCRERAPPGGRVASASAPALAARTALRCSTLRNSYSFRGGTGPVMRPWGCWRECFRHVLQPATGRLLHCAPLPSPHKRA